MKKNLPLFLCLLFTLVIISCSSNKYATDDFKKTTANHEVVALLPIQLTYSGQLPKEMKSINMDSLNANESGKIQEQLYFELLRNNHPRKKNSRLITYQSLQTTNATLEEKGLNVKDLYKRDPKDIAAALDVDAVLFTKVERRILIGDKTTNAVNTGERAIDMVLGIAGANVRTPNLPAGRIYFTISLNEKEKGNTLWQINDVMEYGTKYMNEEVIRSFAEFAGRKIPYRR
jgi:hypothetical protein